jgi:hypothetical protein
MGECEEPPATVPDTCVCPAARQGDVRSMWPPVNSRLRAMRPWVADASTRSSSSKTVWTPTRRSSASATRANTISPPSRGTAISTSSPGSLSTSTRRLSTIVPPTSVAMPWATSPPCRVRESCSRGRAGRDCDDNGSDRNHGGRPAGPTPRLVVPSSSDAGSPTSTRGPPTTAAGRDRRDRRTPPNGPHPSVLLRIAACLLPTFDRTNAGQKRRCREASPHAGSSASEVSARTDGR